MTVLLRVCVVVLFIVVASATRTRCPPGDERCCARSGTCLDVSGCAVTPFVGLCAGGKNRKCCTRPKSSVATEVENILQPTGPPSIPGLPLPTGTGTGTSGPETGTPETGTPETNTNTNTNTPPPSGEGTPWPSGVTDDGLTRISPAVLSGSALETAVTANKKFLHAKSRVNYLFRVQGFLGAKIENKLNSGSPVAVDLAQKTALFERARGKTPTGLVENNFDDMKAAPNGIGNPGYYSTLDAKDTADMAAARAFAQDATSIPSERLRIVRLALSQVGHVNSLDRGDGKKLGGKRILEYYRVAWGDEIFNQNRGKWEPGILKANSYINVNGKKSGPWSWCGIFATWAIRSVTGRGHWGMGKGGGGMLGVGEQNHDVKDAKPGDLIYLKSKLSHQCVVISNDGTHIGCVDGNSMYQGVEQTKRPIGRFFSFISVSDEPWPPAGVDPQELERLTAVESVSTAANSWDK